jgi:hypothetical protein
MGHVGETRKIVLNQIAIAIRNDAVLRIENVGGAMIADLGNRHQVLDRLEVELDDAHTGVGRVPATDIVILDPR